MPYRRGAIVIADVRYRLAAGIDYGAPLLLAVTAGAVYEITVALGWVSLGTLPGEGPRYEGLVLPVALVAILAGTIGSWTLAVRSRRNAFVALLGAAAAAFVVARFQGFDPYYLPTLRRYSDGGAFSPAWVYAVALFAVVASLLCFVRPRAGFILNAPALLLCAFTATFVGVGH
jgi:hypothetical protein